MKLLVDRKAEARRSAKDSEPERELLDGGYDDERPGLSPDGTSSSSSERKRARTSGGMDDLVSTSKDLTDTIIAISGDSNRVKEDDLKFRMDQHDATLALTRARDAAESQRWESEVLLNKEKLVREKIQVKVDEALAEAAMAEATVRKMKAQAEIARLTAAANEERRHMAARQPRRDDYALSMPSIARPAWADSQETQDPDESYAFNQR
jgi:hypothetical protein